MFAAFSVNTLPVQALSLSYVTTKKCPIIYKETQQHLLMDCQSSEGLDFNEKAWTVFWFELCHVWKKRCRPQKELFQQTISIVCIKLWKTRSTLVIRTVTDSEMVIKQVLTDLRRRTSLYTTQSLNWHLLDLWSERKCSYAEGGDLRMKRLTWHFLCIFSFLSNCNHWSLVKKWKTWLVFRLRTYENITTNIIFLTDPIRINPPHWTFSSESLKTSRKISVQYWRHNPHTVFSADRTSCNKWRIFCIVGPRNCQRSGDLEIWLPVLQKKLEVKWSSSIL